MAVFECIWVLKIAQQAISHSQLSGNPIPFVHFGALLYFLSEIWLLHKVTVSHKAIMAHATTPFHATIKVSTFYHANIMCIKFHVIWII